MFASHLTSTLGIKVSWDPFHPDWIASATNINLAQAMITTQHVVHIQHKNEWKRAQTMEVSAEGKLVTMRFEGGDMFTMKTEGQDTTTGCPTLREAIQRNFHTLVRLSQLTEPDRIYGIQNRAKGRRKIGWAQVVYPLRARLQELQKANLHPERQDDTLENKLIDLRKGEQAFMAVRPKLIRAGYTTLDSIPRIQKGSGNRFYCPPLKGVDGVTQESVTRWIQKLHKFPAHLHAPDIKDDETQE